MRRSAVLPGSRSLADRRDCDEHMVTIAPSLTSPQRRGGKPRAGASQASLRASLKDANGPAGTVVITRSARSSGSIMNPGPRTCMIRPAHGAQSCPSFRLSLFLSLPGTRSTPSRLSEQQLASSLVVLRCVWVSRRKLGENPPGRARARVRLGPRTCAAPF